MSLPKVRLELARNAEFPKGSNARGYEFTAPLTADGHLDTAEWREARGSCRVNRFWKGEEDKHGKVAHHRGDRWAFHYDGTEDEDEEEPIFKSDRHSFVPAECASITEHDEVQRIFS